MIASLVLILTVPAILLPSQVPTSVEIQLWDVTVSLGRGGINWEVSSRVSVYMADQVECSPAFQEDRCSRNGGRLRSMKVHLAVGLALATSVKNHELQQTKWQQELHTLGLDDVLHIAEMAGWSTRQSYIVTLGIHAWWTSDVPLRTVQVMELIVPLLWITQRYMFVYGVRYPFGLRQIPSVKHEHSQRRDALKARSFRLQIAAQWKIMEMPDAKLRMSA